MPAEARYTNTFDVGFDAFEFVIDCSQSDPGDGERATAPHTRIITTPAFAKELARLLRVSVDQYEARFGPLPVPDGGDVR
jgi:hypothetical protein